jgi:hypothetical protein
VPVLTLRSLMMIKTRPAGLAPAPLE